MCSVECHRRSILDRVQQKTGVFSAANERNARNVRASANLDLQLFLLWTFAQTLMSLVHVEECRFYLELIRSRDSSGENVCPYS